jgi:hypothetical protein
MKKLYVNWLQSENGIIVEHYEHFSSFAEAEAFALKELPSRPVICNSIEIVEALKVYNVKSIAIAV